MRNTAINSYIAVLAITMLGGMASFAIVKIATDVAYLDELAGTAYTLEDHTASTR